MNIVQIKIESLIPYVNSARTHSDAQVAQIAGSIKEFGFNNPVLIDEESGIIAGHGRVLAARKLNLNTVPCIKLNHLSPAQRKAYILADNKLALNAGWDNDILRLELADLKELDIDTDLTGFTLDEIAKLSPQTTVGLTDEDAVPEVPAIPITKLGDVWLLGKHRVMCGDSTSIDAVEKLMDGQKANMAFTSPPYNVGKSASLSGTKHLGDKKYVAYRDDKTQSEYLDLLIGFTNAWIGFCEFMAVNLQQIAGNKTSFVDYMATYKGNLIDVCIWDKGHAQPAMAKNVMSSRFEYILFITEKKNPSRAIPGANFRGTVSNVYNGTPNRNNEFSKVHAATFPVGFPIWAIESFTSINAIVSDPFGGTGTTLIACEKTGRVNRSMELDPKYCDVIVKRWEDFTGKKAVLE